MTDAEVKPPTIMSVGLKYGMISTAVHILIFLGLALTGNNAFDQKWGFVSLAFSIVFTVLAHREYKLNGNGFMSYGEGFKIGLVMLGVGIIVGTGFQWVYATMVDPEVMNGFFDFQRAQMEEKGTPDNQIDIAMEWTKKLFWPMAIVMGTIFGLIINAIVTAFTQKRNPEPGI